MILLKKALRGFWLLTIVQFQTVIARQQRHKALPVSRPMPALARKPVERVVVVPMLSTVEMESIEVAEQSAAVMVSGSAGKPAEKVAIAELQRLIDIPSSQPKPEQALYPDRTALVMTLLDEAYGHGLTTYPQLINYVKEQTGEGCSRRTIAQWKKGRGLMEAA